LVYGDRRGPDPYVVQAGARELLGERLDERDRRTRDDGHEAVCEVAVVHRVVDVIRSGRRRQVAFQRGVDDEVRTLRTLEGGHAVAAASPQAGERDHVGRRIRPSHRCASVAWYTRIASTVPVTSCTRTPQTPAITARTVVAIVAASRSCTGRGVPSGP